MQSKLPLMEEQGIGRVFGDREGGKGKRYHEERRGKGDKLEGNVR